MVIELSGVQFGLGSYAWFAITSMILDQNCMTRSSITTLLHFFEIVNSIPKTSFAILVCKIFHWFSILKRFVESCKSCLSLSWNLTDFYNQASAQIWVVVVLLKSCDLEHKMVQFVNKSHQWKPIRLQGSQLIQNGYNKTKRKLLFINDKSKKLQNYAGSCCNICGEGVFTGTGSTWRKT